MITIRAATLYDAEHLLQIYDYYVKNTATTFEYETPSIEEFKKRMKKIMQRYPYLIILNDDIIAGYAYAAPFIGRSAYDWSCETTIYIAPDVRGHGLGRKIYEALEKLLCEMGILNLYACIAYPEKNDEYLTSASADFHYHLGFKKIGEFHKCGYKFDRWYNMIWVEKFIGTHIIPASPIKPFRS